MWGLYVGSIPLETFLHELSSTVELASERIRSGLPLSQPLQSHIRNPGIFCNSGQICLDHILIIGTDNKICELRILEFLHIFQIRPQLKSMQSPYPLSLVR